MEDINYWAAIEGAWRSEPEPKLFIENIAEESPILLKQYRNIAQSASKFIVDLSAINGDTFPLSEWDTIYEGKNTPQIATIFWKFCNQIKTVELPKEFEGTVDSATYKRWFGATAADILMEKIEQKDPNSRLFQEVSWASRRMVYDSATLQFTKNDKTYLIDMDWVNKLSIQIILDPDEERRIELLDRFINHPRVLGQHIYP